MCTGRSQIRRVYAPERLKYPLKRVGKRGEGKVPAAGEFRSQEERGAEVLAIVPETKLLECGRRALAAVVPTPLYARIDFVRDASGDFVVMELELIEPSLYLRTDPEAPVRFARAVDRWFAGD